MSSTEYRNVQYRVPKCGICSVPRCPGTELSLYHLGHGPVVIIPELSEEEQTKQNKNKNKNKKGQRKNKQKQKQSKTKAQNKENQQLVGGYITFNMLNW